MTLGIFDSGSGGLTVLREVKRRAPDLDIIYLADFKNLPYGEKTAEELGALTAIAIERLILEGAENIVSACNSVSASTAQPLIDILGRQSFGMIEMVGPTVKELLPLAKRGAKILLVATEATVRSGIYARGFKRHGIDIQSTAIPPLVLAIESNAPQEKIHTIIRKALRHAKPFDILVLGCTQYPLVYDIFDDVLIEEGKGAVIFNPCEPVAEEVINRFGTEGEGTIRFLLTAPAPLFEERIEQEFRKEEVLEPAGFLG